MVTINKQVEAVKLVQYINNDVRMGFSATSHYDTVLLSFTGYGEEFEISLEFSHEYKVWMLDFCQYSVKGRLPNFASHKSQLGFITLAIAKYNVALEKRLSK
jgi:hypothetical protein